MDDIGKRMLRLLRQYVADRGVPESEQDQIISGIEELHARQVGTGSSCDALVSVSVSSTRSGRVHVWLHVTWRYLNPDRDAALMAELGREFDSVMGSLSIPHIAPHIEFVTWSAVKRRDFTAFMSRFAEEESFDFCGVWPAPSLVLQIA